MARSTYTTREPWTESFHRLANTVNQILEARNQRAAIEQQSKAMQQKQELEKIKTGYEMTNKAMSILGDKNIHKSLKDAYVENFNNSVAGPFGITPLPKDLNYDDESFGNMIKQIDAVKKQLEKGTIGLGEVPQIFNTIIDDNMSRYGADSKETKALESIVKRHKETIGNERFSTFKDIASRPESMGKTPEEQASVVGQMAGNLSQIDPQLAKQLESEFGDMQKTQKGFKFTGASVFRGEDGNWWRWNPVTGNPEVYTRAKSGKYEFINDPTRPVPDAVSKELARTPMSAMEKGVTMDQIAGNVQRIKDNFKPDWVGPVAGRAYRVQEATTGLKDDNQSIFYADVNDIADMLLRARSGAQINEQEYTRLSKLVPTPNLPPKVFNERLDRFTKQFSQAIEAWERRLSGGRYLTPPRAPQTNNVTKEANTPKKTTVGRFTVEVE